MLHAHINISCNVRQHGKRVGSLVVYSYPVLSVLKQTTLSLGRYIGVFSAIANSQWRRQRLLILCYHGVSIRDEHEWKPTLYVSDSFFRRRMELLARLGCHVLSLTEAVAMLQSGTLPPKAVVITFDDGLHDFQTKAFPIIREFGFPATVYQTTYYCDHPFPIFNLIVDYILWRARDKQFEGAAFGIGRSYDLSSELSDALRDLLGMAAAKDLRVEEKEALAARLAEQVGVDYQEIHRLRLLQLMTAEELTEIFAAGIDVQLHTHRHRTPQDEALFTREIEDNRRWITSHIGANPVHFCYPSGRYDKKFFPWLRSQAVTSATTCQPGLATRDSHPFLLPRLLDAMNVTEADFEAWASGIRALLPVSDRK